MEYLDNFIWTLEAKLVELVAARRLYLTDRIVHRSPTSTDDVVLSARIAGTSIEIWIYEDEAQFGGGGIDFRFERIDYNTPEEHMATFLARLEDFLPEAELIEPIKLPILINESSEIGAPGDVQFFERLSDAEGYIEVVDVENEEYSGFDADGRLLRFDIVSERVRISAAETAPDHKETLRSLLVLALQSSGDVDEAWPQSASLPQLVERSADVFPSSITIWRKKQAKVRQPALLDRFLSLFRK